MEINKFQLWRIKAFVERETAIVALAAAAATITATDATASPSKKESEAAHHWSNLLYICKLF